MTDIERRLRDLGERMREEQAPATMPAEVQTSAKRRRTLTAVTSVLTVGALIAGATYAVASLGGGRADFGPAESRGTPGPAAGTFFADFEAGQITVIADGEVELLCAATQEIGGIESVSRIEVVGPNVLVTIYPAKDQVDSEEEDFPCIGDVPEDFVRTLTGSPDLYSLAIEGPNGAEESPLELGVSSEPPDQDRCQDSVPFEPTFLPRGWSADFQEGSASGADLELVIGHFGTSSDPGTLKMGQGFLDVTGRAGTFDRQPDEEAIGVLGSTGGLTGPNDNGGYGVRFGFDGCIYSLIGNLSREDLVKFAQGLRPSG